MAKNTQNDSATDEPDLKTSDLSVLPAFIGGLPAFFSSLLGF
jgi:hypothetical protein